MTGRRAGRPSDPRKVAAIVEAAWSLFLERGVEATPIEAVAARAGVSKVTLYSHFADKAVLFEAAVLAEMERIEAAQRPGGRGPGEDGGDDRGRAGDLQADLRAFGLGLMRFLTSKPAIDFYSVVAGDLRRHADLARTFYDRGPGRTRSNLAALLAGAAERGELAPPCAEQAADELFGLWQGFTNFQLALGVDVDALRADLEARVDRGIAVFLAAYGSAQAPRPRRGPVSEGGVEPRPPGPGQPAR